ncbi:hypothetical protein NPIL_487711 [Nephila pilipes]|uniref:Uncharacterized protein n=1 Tax=Nephila pilipes TaxID=299642 RepID=A0A8X6PXB0_NEPPI|nr:hypothetical protein NPIL_487711 [Nephila pilipes]
MVSQEFNGMEKNYSNSSIIIENWQKTGPIKLIGVGLTKASEATDSMTISIIRGDEISHEAPAILSHPSLSASILGKARSSMMKIISENKNGKAIEASFIVSLHVAKTGKPSLLPRH